MSNPKKLKKRYFDVVYVRDAWEALLGAPIGTGCTRLVYENARNKKEVVKIERDDWSKDNLREWDIYNALEQTKWGDWLAPVVWISANGKILIQKRTYPFIGTPLPTKIPSFLEDVHKKNFGMYENRIVCHDYAQTNFIKDSSLIKLKKPKWGNGNFK